ncbi:MAG: hypothetical protein K9I82_06030 [Chitinophagaceae bacterium]|nr:hypothetical protein [Chitinophagaceae bacterium]
MFSYTNLRFQKSTLLYDWIIPSIIVLMWGGLLWSRALLSISFILFVVLSVVFEGKTSIKLIKESFWLKTMLALVLVYALSGFWSEDKAQWVKTVQVKLPLLFMPFTLGILVKISKETCNKLLYVFAGLVVISTGWSYIFYFFTENITLTYLQAKVLPVPMYDDHVRFSWLVVVLFAMLLDRIFKKSLFQERWILAGLLVYLIVYLHVLAAKTGVLGLYIVSAIFLWKQVSGKLRLYGLMILLMLPVVSWFLLPSFQSRLRFILWDFQNYSRGNYTEGLSDAPRILSFQAGAAIVKSNFLNGVGSGDVLQETIEWYKIHAPFLKPYEQLLPCNQILMFVCSGGVLMGLIALVFFLSPFWIKILKNNYLWVSFHLVALFGFMYEIGLEVQNGVFIYIFFGIYIYASDINKKTYKSL